MKVIKTPNGWIVVCDKHLQTLNYAPTDIMTKRISAKAICYFCRLDAEKIA
jgi:hypothetical protein